MGMKEVGIVAEARFCFLFADAACTRCFAVTLKTRKGVCRTVPGIRLAWAAQLGHRYDGVSGRRLYTSTNVSTPSEPKEAIVNERRALPSIGL